MTEDLLKGIKREHDFVPPEANPPARRSFPLAAVLLALGFAAIAFSFGMDTTVETATGGRVHNIGLLATQRNFLTVGCVTFLAGLIVSIRK